MGKLLKVILLFILKVSGRIENYTWRKLYAKKEYRK